MMTPLGLMGGAPLTHPDEIVGDKPEAVVEPDLTPEPEAEQEEDVLAASPLFAPEPQVPRARGRRRAGATGLCRLHHANPAGRGAQ